MLKDAFPNSKVTAASSDQIRLFNDAVLRRSLSEKIISRLLCADHTLMYEKENFKYNKRYLTFKNGRVEGYWQNSVYFNDIRDIIKPELVFAQLPCEDEFKQSLVNDEYSVGLHIRLTDYLNAKESYGGICTKEYYLSGIKYIEEMIGHKCSLYVFSDDISSAGEMFYDVENVHYVSTRNKPDWYDMYLMTLCRHNIIANSTFSWWGAWLNDNEKKIVIQPNKWDHKHPDLGIHVKEWISIREDGFVIGRG